jgi:hypothetical protein
MIPIDFRHDDGYGCNEIVALCPKGMMWVGLPELGYFSHAICHDGKFSSATTARNGRQGFPDRAGFRRTFEP